MTRLPGASSCRLPGLPAQPPVRVKEVQCVEVARAPPAHRSVRDSKNPSGLVVNHWRGRLDSLREQLSPTPRDQVHCTWSRGHEIGHG
ncbi:DUF397 domain-containing protein [Streptomyces chartreusis]